MATNPCDSLPRYKNLGDELMAKFNNDHSLSWLARKIDVTRGAVHLWLTGKCRPQQERLGHIAAILDLEPDVLAELADYVTEEDKARVRAAYVERIGWRQQRQGLASVEQTFIEQIRSLALRDRTTQIFLNNTCPEYLNYIRTSQLDQRAYLNRNLGTF